MFQRSWRAISRNMPSYFFSLSKGVLTQKIGVPCFSCYYSGSCQPHNCGTKAKLLKCTTNNSLHHRLCGPFKICAKCSLASDVKKRSHQKVEVVVGAPDSLVRWLKAIRLSSRKVPDQPFHYCALLLEMQGNLLSSLVVPSAERTLLLTAWSQCVHMPGIARPPHQV